MSEPQLLIERQNHVAIVTFNDPKTRNAFSKEMMVRAADAYQALNEDHDVRAIIVTGADGNFSSGSNLKEQVARHDTEWQRRLDEDQELWMRAFLRVKRPLKPIIAAIEGFALAGGTEITLASDIRVAGKSAQFGLTEAQLGLVPLGGGTARLVKQVPYAIAIEMLVTGKRIHADEAAAIGLLNYVVEDGSALSKALEIADRIAKNGPHAVRTILGLARQNIDLDEEKALANELAQGFARITSKEAEEGRRAFAEKRLPHFE